MKQRSEQQHRAVAATSEWGSASAKLDDRRILSNSTIWFQKYKIAYFSPDKLLRAHIQIQLYLGFSAKLFRFVRQCQRVRCFVVLKLIKKKTKSIEISILFYGTFVFRFWCCCVAFVRLGRVPPISWLKLSPLSQQRRTESKPSQLVLRLLRTAVLPGVFSVFFRE